ncbi:uncharacterized protein P174DRAFT_448139 [Aspergillus novofumigatus IBT 16806]|uniref:BZIP domain-containing protein n=1 Tax=Aspergillus novofumigatus (strain IBT 16806) TaxID=1392255 RepID=A0A2I1CFA1_ASPN1|nr:uncharacterized protein P174DRAFT_448139 [Aspergillus novofumigatus IBT 16806]PKX96323.1 hypothetical protein P174DRAFT_448139 [Aspergillus novofumigatus IBT 16806]
MSNTYRTDISVERIQLASMPQLAEAITRKDDWTGVTDAAARRRAQTRLNTRAYRKRKALAAKEAEVKATNAATETPTKSGGKEKEAMVECWDITAQSVTTIPATLAKQISRARKPLLPSWPPAAAATAHPGSLETQPWTQSSNSIIFPLCSDHLITLLQFNTIRALATNRTLISGILTTPLDCYEEVTHVIPYPSHPQLGRDRLILAVAAGSFDEDELWADCIGGLYEGFPDAEHVDGDAGVERRGVIVWSPPWDIRGWEMTKGFLEKWGWLLGDLPGAMEGTNRWRRERGEEPL